MNNVPKARPVKHMHHWIAKSPVWICEKCKTQRRRPVLSKPQEFRHPDIGNGEWYPLGAWLSISRNVALT